MKYNLVQNDENANITVLLDGDLYGADSTHANWHRILEKVTQNDETGLADLFDASVAASKRFEKLSERVAIRNGRIYFDGEEVDNALTQQVVRFLNEGVDDFKPLVAFFEKVQQNPNNHSREQLYGWLAKYKFTITEDGDFLAYKSAHQEHEGSDYQFRSTQSGYAIVDGEEQNGYTQYSVGSVVEMPRGSVQWNPSVGCSTGLHAGTWNYASTFTGSAKLLVKINPRDVVSVPTDSEEQKLRVCRLVVEGYAEKQIETPLWTPTVEPEVDEDDGDGLCPTCGGAFCEGDCEDDACETCGSEFCDGCEDEDDEPFPDDENTGTVVYSGTFVVQPPGQPVVQQPQRSWWQR